MQYKILKNIYIFISLVAGLLISYPTLANSRTDAKTGGLNLIADPEDINKRFWFKLNGQIKGDMTVFTGDTQDKRQVPLKKNTHTALASGAYLRTLEINLNGGLGKDLSYMITLAPENAKDINIHDAYIKYTGLAKNVHIMVGQVPMPYGFENSTSGKWTSFLEKSMPTADFTTSFRLGALVNAWSDMFAGSVAITQPKFHMHNSIDDKAIKGVAIGKSDRFGMASRFIFSPVHTQENGYHKVLHFSAGVRFQDEFDTYNGKKINNLQFRARPEGRIGDTPYILNTGDFNAKNYMVYSSEFAWISGPFTLQAEYGQAHVRRDNLLGNPIFKGWYAQASYILTGESRVYNFPTGTLGRIIPKDPSGAWEIALRRSYLNLNSRDIRGGIAYNTGFALGWYANSSVRIFGNYIRSNFHLKGQHKRIVNIFGMRCQVVF